MGTAVLAQPGSVNEKWGSHGADELHTAGAIINIKYGVLMCQESSSAMGRTERALALLVIHEGLSPQHPSPGFILSFFLVGVGVDHTWQCSG